jgi:hypothetical protein
VFRPPYNHHQAHPSNPQATIFYVIVEFDSSFEICFVCRIKLVKVMIKIKINIEMYALLLPFTRLFIFRMMIFCFFVLAGFCCCLVSEMNDIAVLSFFCFLFCFHNVLAMGRRKCYVCVYRLELIFGGS